MKVSQVTFREAKNSSNDKLLGFADIVIDAQLVIKGIRVTLGQYGPFLGFPSRKGEDGKYYDLVFPIKKELRDAISDAVLKEVNYNGSSSTGKDKEKEEDDFFDS